MRGAAEKARYWLTCNMIPVTKSLMVINLGTFLVIELFHVNKLLFYLGFFVAGPLQINNLWTAVTYPLLGCGSVLCLLFSVSSVS